MTPPDPKLHPVPQPEPAAPAAAPARPGKKRRVLLIVGLVVAVLAASFAAHAFLTRGDVFTRDQIESYIELKWEEVYAFEHTPHPIEFQMYYSV